MSSDTQDIVYGIEALKKLQKGVETAYDVVAATLGSHYKNTLVQQSFGAPEISSSCHRILKTLELPDPIENMGVSLIKDMAANVYEECGDGSATAVVIAAALVKYAIPRILAGQNPVLLKREIDSISKKLQEALTTESTQIKNEKDYRDIALAAASGNEEVANLLAEAVKKVGPDGVITIEEAKTVDTCVETQEGMQFDRGYLSPYFVTDSDKMIAELASPQVLVTTKKISSIQELLPILQSVSVTGSELFIIADDFENEVLSTLIVNRLRGALKVCPIKAPAFGDRRTAMLEDIAVLIGAELVDEKRGLDLKNVTPDHLGNAEKIVVTKDKTTIVGGAGKNDAIRSRIQLIKNEEEKVSSSYDKEKLKERRAKLESGTATIRVGASTEAEMNEKKFKLENALNAVKAASEQGISIGSTAAYIHALKAVEVEDCEKDSFDIWQKVVKEPLIQLMKNAGIDDTGVFLQEIETKGADFGMNLTTKRVEKLIPAGIIDPTKVLALALKYATSVAGVLITTDAIIGKGPAK